MTYFYHNHQVYPQLPMARVSYLPHSGFEVRPVRLRDGADGVYMVFCRPRQQGSQAHRLIAHCHCGAQVPIGRMGRHYRPGRCDLRAEPAR